MRRLLGVAALGLVVLSGCGASEAADEFVNPFHGAKVKRLYAPKTYCDQVKEQAPADDGRATPREIYRVVCLKNQQWRNNLDTACKEDPASVTDQYWAYIPQTDQAGYIGCKELGEIAEVEDAEMRALLEDVRDHRGEYERGERKLP